MWSIARSGWEDLGVLNYGEISAGDSGGRIENFVHSLRGDVKNRSREFPVICRNHMTILRTVDQLHKMSWQRPRNSDYNLFSFIISSYR